MNYIKDYNMKSLTKYSLWKSICVPNRQYIYMYIAKVITVFDLERLKGYFGTICKCPAQTIPKCA